MDDSNIEVPEGASTTSTTLTLKGKASPGLKIEGYDGSGPSAVSKGTATASATGDWELPITVSAAVHRLYAKSLYHPTNTYSDVRNLTVIPPLAIDTSLMTLDQISFFNSYGWPYAAWNESSETRAATGGVLPYTFTSGNPNIATVDGNAKVIAIRNGTTTITVSDASGRSVSYTVNVENVYQLVVNDTMMTADQARAWTLGIGGRGEGNLEFLPITHLASYGRDLFDNRIYPDPLSYRFCQINPLGMSFRVWEGDRLAGAYWPWGSAAQMRAHTAVPS